MRDAKASETQSRVASRNHVVTTMKFLRVVVGGLSFFARSTDRAIIAPYCKIISGESRRPVDAV